MLNSYGPILIFGIIAAVFAPATLWIFKFIRPKFRPTPEKVMPYECGITPESDARHRFTVRFYVVAILFVIFDVETIFLYPWAVQFQALMPLRPGGDGDLPRHPDCRLYLAVEIRRPRLGLGRDFHRPHFPRD